MEDNINQEVIGEISDGYHTFNELYHHRAVLFSIICNDRPNLSWKSKLHHDGTMYDGMFIVGINTKDGQATYHYDIEPYWNMFNVPELPMAPEWDGHTPSEAIERISKLDIIQNEDKSLDKVFNLTDQNWASMYEMVSEKLQKVEIKLEKARESIDKLIGINYNMSQEIINLEREIDKITFNNF